MYTCARAYYKKKQTPPILKLINKKKEQFIQKKCLHLAKVQYITKKGRRLSGQNEEKEIRKTNVTFI
uniref:Uncharacterized protein n=1 Tax=Bacteroides fragilis TaxID=817 RepID=A0A0I9RXL3_BACFG